MSIELIPGKYFYAIWFAGNGQEDLLGAIWKEESTGEILMTYRFHYYSKDKINWYTAKAPTDDSPDQLIEKAKKVSDMYAAEKSATVNDFVTINGDYEKALEILQKYDWIEIKLQEV